LRHVFVLPDLGEGLVDALVVAWRVAEGDEVARDAPLAEVETEKANVEVPSPVAGRVVELHAAPGERVEVGRPLVTFEVGEADRPGIVGAVPREGSRARRVRLRPPAGEESSSELTAGTDVRIHVALSSRREAMPVLLVHGFDSSHADWSNSGWTLALERAGRAWLAPDLRGHGRSDKPHDPEAYRSSVLVGDLVGALDAAGVAEADVVGYSLGGELALELATRHPERVRRLVAGGIGERRPLTAEDTERVYRYAVEGGPRPDGPAYGMWARAGGRPGSDRVALAACLAGVSGSPPLDGLERFTGPALLFAGTADDVAAGLEALAARLPDAEVLRLSGRNHATALSAPEARERATRFLDAQG